MTKLLVGLLVVLLALLNGNDAKNLLSLTELPLNNINTHTSHINNVQFRIHFAALPRDLRVVAVLLNGTRNIGLNVTWQPGNTDIEFAPTSSYTLLIVPMNKSEEGTKYCGNLSYHQDLEPDTVSWLVTFDLHHEDSHLRVYPECTYKIRLWANPRERDVTAELHLDFTVPRCVKGVDYEEVCSCRLSESSLPPVHIESLTSIDSGRYQVTWSVEKPESADLTEANFLVITGPMYLRPFDEQASLYALETAAEVPYSNERPSYVARFNTSVDEAEHVLILRVKDRFHCLGPATNRTFLESLSQWIEEEDGNAQLVMGVVVPSVAVLLVLALGILVLALAPRGNLCRSWLRRKTRHGTLQTVKSWRPSYRIVSRHGETGGNERYISNRLSAEERNVLYVEQEIQEALERGDVDRYEVSYDRIHLGKQIGRGAFGRVFLARIDSVNGTPIDKMIAVKKLKHRASPDELDDFLTEISTFKRVGHHSNVVSLVGCCTLTLPYCMLMEWVPCGDLLRYLRRLRAQLNNQRAQVAAAAAVPPPRPCRHTTADNPYIDVLPEFALPSCVECSYVTPETPRADVLRRGSSTSHSESSSQMQVDGPSSLGNSSSSGQARRSPQSRQASSTLETPLPAVELDARELHSFALQIARGMAHLERQQITHRDLAARNVLIDQNRTLKISDFGLSRRGIYVNTKRRKVPLRWLSIEAMRDHLYSSRSDVWAFGVVLWEIGTLGGFPYPTVADGDLLNFLLHGKRLEKPQNCTNELYELMTRCWSFEAEERPTFAETCSLLEASLEHRQVYVDFANLVSAASDELPPVQQSS